MPSTRVTDVHVCDACGFSAPRWFGRCPDCGEWNSASAPSATAGSGATVALSSVGTADDRVRVGPDEFDRVAGGGLVRGSMNLLAGQPGIGKSTLLLQVLAGAVRNDVPALLISAEESLPQVARRAGRLQIPLDRIHAIATTSLDRALAAAQDVGPGVVVVDSIQTVADPSVDGAAGTLNQVRSSAARLIRFAKETGSIVIAVGHVTKDGAIAGPKALEHAVDAVFGLEGDRSGSMRLLRASKNRFGACDETGVFTMTSEGLQVVEDPSAMLLADRSREGWGSIVFPAMQGSRPLLIEIQGLVAKTDLAQPRRVPIGVDPKRLSLLLAVLAGAGNAAPQHDVFVAAAGGIAIKEPGADLAISLALVSAVKRWPIDHRTIAIGEVGLGGEVRRVPDVRRRLFEAARLGFTRAFVPRGVGDDLPLEVVEIAEVTHAFRHLERAARAAAA